MELYYKKYTKKPEVVKLKLGRKNHLLHSFSNKTQNLKQTAILVGKIFILHYRICQRTRNMQGQKVVTGMICTKSSISGTNPLRNDLYGFCPAAAKTYEMVVSETLLCRWWWFRPILHFSFCPDLVKTLTKIDHWMDYLKNNLLTLVHGWAVFSCFLSSHLHVAYRIMIFPEEF